MGDPAPSLGDLFHARYRGSRDRSLPPARTERRPRLHRQDNGGTDRIESKLQETPNLDYLKSYTIAGQTTIFVNLKDSTPPAQVPGIWQVVREKVRDISNTLPRGVVGPGFNSEFGDTFGIVYGFTADGYTDRELRDYVVEVRKQLLQLADVTKIDILGAQDERVYIEFSTEQLAGLGVDRAELIAALHAQNAVTPAGVVQTEDEKILVRVSGAFRSEQDVLAVNFVAQNGRIIRLGDIARVTRGPADPAQPMFRVNGHHGIGLAIAMRTGGDVLALGRNIEQAMTEITATLPVGIEPTPVADQPVTVEHAVDDFMEALWEAIAIVLAVSLVALGLRAGAVVAISIPLVLATVFVAMKFFGIDLQRISLGALIIALGLLVDDAMITIEAMVTRLERGDEKEQAGIFAYTSTAFPMLPAHWSLSRGSSRSVSRSVRRASTPSRFLPSSPSHWSYPGSSRSFLPPCLVFGFSRSRGRRTRRSPARSCARSAT